MLFGPIIISQNRDFDYYKRLKDGRVSIEIENERNRIREAVEAELKGWIKTEKSTIAESPGFYSSAGGIAALREVLALLEEK